MSVCGISTKGNEEQSELIRLICDHQHPIVFCTGKAGTGKALANNTPVLTSNGWKEIGQLTLEDKVAARDGKFYQITGIFPQGEKEVFKVTFSDDTVIECCNEHLWFVNTASRRSRKASYEVKTLQDIIDNVPLKIKSGNYNKANCYIPMAQPIQFPQQEHLIHPYLLGALLGDGCITDTGASTSFATNDVEMVELINNYLKPLKYQLHYTKAYNYNIIRTDDFDININTPLRTELKRLNIYGTNSHTKFIPKEYLYDSVENRIELLCGIIDTDGHCGGSYYDICCTSKQLILDIKELCESLGMTAVYGEKQMTCTNSTTNNYNCGTAYRLYIKTTELIPKIHKTKHREEQWKKPQSYARRTIEKIEKTNKVTQMTCISVDSPDKSFIIKNYIVTHNTFIATAAATELLKNKRYAKIMYLRNPVQCGENVGYLPGNIEDKLNPFMMALTDNLTAIEQTGGEIKAADIKQKIEILPVFSIRGRSIPPSTILIVDECQNLDLVTLRTILTRMGKFCKIIMLGSFNQIDDPKQRRQEKCDFQKTIEKLTEFDFVAHVELYKSMRSEYCAIIDEAFEEIK